MLGPLGNHLSSKMETLKHQQCVLHLEDAITHKQDLHKYIQPHTCLFTLPYSLLTLNGGH